MRSKLIADAGSTKIEWRFLPADGSETESFATKGINPFLSSESEIMETLRSVASRFSSVPGPEEIHFYGAGCASSAICDAMARLLRGLWKDSEISVESDLLAAARALFGRDKGIACILGTGSNSCLYDGAEIAAHIPSLGFVLGDEGGGAALGKRLVADVFKCQLPEDVRDAFFRAFCLTEAELLENVYRKSNPGRFLASFVPFLKENIHVEAVRSLVVDEFRRFVVRNLAMYPEARSLRIGAVGSVAHHFGPQLKEAASSLGYDVALVCKAPMEGLVDFHTDNN